MNKELISLFIDDEMNLDEKMVFVETIHADSIFTEETLDFLKQEKLLTILQTIDRPMPHPARKPFSWRTLFPLQWPFKALAAGMATVMLVFFIMSPETKSQKIMHRFVIFEPDTQRVEIAGSFTRWKPLPMKSIGRNGYWEVTIPLDPGEYEYSYFLDGKKSVADPTVQFREEDDFGNNNSIIRIGI